MEIRENLTTEKINKTFENQFDLVNYAIKMVEELVMSGRHTRVKYDVDNPALIVLEEILKGKDKFEEEKEEKKIVYEDLVPKEEDPKKAKKEARKTKSTKI